MPWKQINRVLLIQAHPTSIVQMPGETPLRDFSIKDRHHGLYFLFNSVQPTTYNRMAQCTHWNECPFPCCWCFDWCSSQHQYLQMEEWVMCLPYTIFILRHTRNVSNLDIYPFSWQVISSHTWSLHYVQFCYIHACLLFSLFDWNKMLAKVFALKWVDNWQTFM